MAKLQGSQLSLLYELPPEIPRSYEQSSPWEQSLKHRRGQLMQQIDFIRRSGDVAPNACSIESHPTSKKLADGTRKQFRYWRVVADKPIFQSQSGKMTRYVYLGSESSARYLDWQERIQRRRAIAQLEKLLNGADHQLQQLHQKTIDLKPLRSSSPLI